MSTPDQPNESESDQIRTTLRSILFHSLPWPEVGEVAKLGQIDKYESGALIIRENEIIRGLHVLLSGRAEVRKAQGTKVTTLEAGNFFGEISILGESVSTTASVVADGPCAVMSFGRQQFDNWLKEHPEHESRILRNLALELCKRLHATTDRIMGS